MARKTKTVVLFDPWVDADLGKRLDKVVLREPSAQLFFEFGPLSTNFVKAGVETTIDIEGVLLNYLNYCVENVEHGELQLMLRSLSLRDGLAIRRTFASFFAEAVSDVLDVETKAVLAAMSVPPDPDPVTTNAAA